ncbi:MAG: type IV toxin-antitoxin system AbiEi family antitoxin domain-containing protein [Thermomicrobiales bacterium]
MNDTAAVSPDFSCLFGAASGQRGYFTSTQALACGFTWSLLTYHAQRGKFTRVRRGLYRLRDYPSSSREEVVAAWLAVGKDKALVSHESALDLLNLSDVIPRTIHLTVPRSKRYLPTPQGVTIHTTTRPLRPADVSFRDGIRLTSATRTILDAAEAGTGPEQIELAVKQAIARGLTTRTLLQQAAQERSQRVVGLIAGALDQATR